jgi:hypothetical protein
LIFKIMEVPTRPGTAFLHQLLRPKPRIRLPHVQRNGSIARPKRESPDTTPGSFNNNTLNCSSAHYFRRFKSYPIAGDLHVTRCGYTEKPLEPAGVEQIGAPKRNRQFPGFNRGWPSPCGKVLDMNFSI